MGAWLRLRRLSPAAAAYVATVTLLGAIGFALDLPALIGVAALLTLPVSIVAIPVFYVLAGLLGLVPGASPSHASGSGIGGPGGVVVVHETGMPATWYLVSVDVLGVVVLVVAALADLLLVEALIRWRHRVHAGA